MHRLKKNRLHTGTMLLIYATMCPEKSKPPTRYTMEMLNLNESE